VVCRPCRRQQKQLWLLSLPVSYFSSIKLLDEFCTNYCIKRSGQSLRHSRQTCHHPAQGHAASAPPSQDYDGTFDAWAWSDPSWLGRIRCLIMDTGNRTDPEFILLLAFLLVFMNFTYLTLFFWFYIISNQRFAPLL
jgi:hypothetical protein